METFTKTVGEFIDRVNLAAAGQEADPYALLDDDVRVFINGTTPLSGIFRGPEQVARILVSAAKRRVASFHMELVEFVGAGPRLVVRVIVTGSTPGGTVFNEDRADLGIVFEVRDGKIVEIKAFPDTMLIEMALFGKKYVPRADRVG
ncbi:MAG: nuclear transport factor 2 family protein [Alphaproteobacteria bacterium]|jgi:ketosteroid isomerase-like protein|nr:nuclear transport factor 2 family protein [Alphaproteobacteria bacterium]|tara:strand:- start:2988 stop:3428 length:441 start_codon:yes stop_codon:yes gene_type:complete